MTTMRDIAREAGVSAMTVSNVLKGRERKVSTATRERVLAVVAKHGFVLDAAASALSSNRSNIIALVYPSTAEPLANPHDAAFIGAVERHVSHTDGDVTRHLMIWSAEDRDVTRTADTLRTWRMDGAIFYGTFGDEVDALHERLDIPLVFVDNYSTSPRVNRVGIDDRGGGALAAAHLLEQGHRRLGFVGSPLHRVGVVRERYQGFRDAADAAGARVDALDCAPRFEDGRELAIRLSTDPARPTGLFAAADILAIGLLNGFLGGGVDVPGQVSLIGFDDMPEAGHVLPALTTIRQDVDAKAGAAVARLVGLIGPDPDPGGHAPLDVQLVRRGTVGPPPAASPERRGRTTRS